MTEATLIDGKAYAQTVRGRVAQAVTALKDRHALTPGLAVVLVGEDPASQVYVRNKNKATLEAGMQGFEHRLSAETTEGDLLKLVAQLNEDPRVNGILVQLPLPKQIDEAAVIAAIHPDKDVDGFHVINAGRLWTGGAGTVPCTPLGCLHLIRHHLGADGLSGKKALVVGRSNIVGKPMAGLLLNESCTVTVAHSRTADLAAECRQADILVAAVGRPNFIKGDWIKPGATVIDVGINRMDAGEGKTKLVGDVEFATASTVAGGITPVPGGVGPMTIAMLLYNTVRATCLQAGVPVPEELDA
ncbi:Methylenetetrahydrofolate dehydrogenase [Caenispirillum salinarum AK4]|uniref:Bifunctional protein FolD n=1 Tax=Caenispirillum salinarum AK4 TaxID=1238182 RepID=K9H185_9PROT|nr:bifunctional methylenetetrahydrofolate dehydrogenase/methenyltetrahydrofolate cyclohydrolase FolD [Caenispirillum salinarum]EKV32020.1 Methylenetetrahydrofolate dehydrogenase [Caenispirillum salinarum AK4]